MRTSANKKTQNPNRSRVGCGGNSSGSSASRNMTSSNHTSATKTYRYTVLYYKRKNKIHKSKGASKLDGTLAFVASPESSTTPVSVTLTSIDTGAVVHRGGMRDHSGIFVFDVDETISIGAYEVEILSCETDDNNSNSKNNNNNKKNATPSTIVSSKNNRSKVIRNREPLGSGGDTNIRSSTSQRLGFGGGNQIIRRGGLGVRRPLAGTTRKPALQPYLAPRKKTKTPPSVDSENSENGTIISSSPKGASSSSSSSLPVLVSRRKANTMLPGFKRPSLCTKATTTMHFPPTCSNTNTVSNRRRAKLLSSSSSIEPVTIITTNTNTNTRNGDEQKNFFPGAIGTPMVPHSIRKVLRPHQIEGVVFLWNCLTGNRQAANLSPHFDDRKDVCDDTSSCDSNSNDKLSTRISSNDSPKGCILSDEMGLGKTLMTIATIAALHRQNRNNRFVVVCPSSLVSNWAREFDKWLGNVGLPKRVVVKKGGEEGLRQIKAFGAIKPSNISEVLIVSYDLFRTKASILKNVQRVALLVVDEGHRLKNTSGSLTMTALESLPCEARLCITATPIQNNLGDMYTIVNFVCPGVLGDIATFRKEYERPITAIASNPKTCTSDQSRRGKESVRTLEKIIQSLMLRRLQKDVLKKMLPPRHVFLLFCRPTLQQRKLYENISNFHCSKGVAGAGDSSQEALSALMGLRKICTHPKLLHCLQSDSDDGAAARSIKDCEGSGKLLVLRDIILQMREKEPTDKIVIISNFTSTLTVIEDAILRELNLNFLRLDGSIRSADRQSLVDTFNRTNADMNFALTLSSKAGGVGLNLIGANRLIMVDPDWNPATDFQAMARIYREGQKKKCFIYRCFTSGTLEEIILQRQIQKGSLATMTMDRAQKSNKTRERMNADELRDCFTLKDERCVCDTRQKVGNWPDYDGKASLVSQGCQDTVLLAVAAAKEDDNDSLLSFVHIVKDDDAKAHQDATTRSEGKKLGGKVDCDSDNESEMDQDYDFGIDDKETGGESGTSDDEYEFE